MRKSTKVLIGILIILIICLVSYIIYISQNEITSTINIENETQNEVENENMVNEIENTTNTTNTLEENNIQNQTTQNASNETANPNISNNNITGKEEQESYEQSGGVNPDEKAIDLAKQEWGETAENYLFAVEDIQGNIYRIAVISNATTIGYIEVNLDTGEAKEV